MLQKIIKQLFRAVIVMFFATILGAVIAYSSSMLILILGLVQYGNEIMQGVFIAFVVVFVMVMYTDIAKKYEKKQPTKGDRRNYFEEGDYLR